MNKHTGKHTFVRPNTAKTTNKINGEIITVLYLCH